MDKKDHIWKLITRWIDGEATRNEINNLKNILAARPDIAGAARLLYRLNHASVHDCKSEAGDAAHLNIGNPDGNDLIDEGLI